MLLPHIVHASATGRLAASPLGRSIQHPWVRVLSLLITIASTVDIEWRQWQSLPSVVTLQGEAPLQISLRSRSSLIWLHLLPSVPQHNSIQYGMAESKFPWHYLGKMLGTPLEEVHRVLQSEAYNVYGGLLNFTRLASWLLNQQKIFVRMCSFVRPPQPSDFEFNLHGSHLELESRQSFADELFADGMILPIFHMGAHNMISPINPTRISLPVPPIPGPPETRPLPRSFWRFMRSGGSTTSDRKRQASFLSLQPLLSRSNSADSVPTPKHSLQNQVSVKKMVKSSSFSASSSSSPLSMSGYDGHHRWNRKTPILPRKTNHLGPWNQVHKVSPVLNVPSAYIVAAANLFGLGSFFCSGKDKKKIRR
ncbi:hypothetical protein SAY86_024879 [Trapa natans]|uniref:Uncharacterized protein n=1 Tax=Trapa natans TaxID=22666 RepID=A0AAN7M7E0_TRANT|nr:hypothetical protein SAY86_024879 [Trapa natans]